MVAAVLQLGVCECACAHHLLARFKVGKKASHQNCRMAFRAPGGPAEGHNASPLNQAKVLTIVGLIFTLVPNVPKNLF